MRETPWSVLESVGRVNPINSRYFNDSVVSLGLYLTFNRRRVPPPLIRHNTLQIYRGVRRIIDGIDEDLPGVRPRSFTLATPPPPMSTTLRPASLRNAGNRVVFIGASCSSPTDCRTPPRQPSERWSRGDRIRPGRVPASDRPGHLHLPQPCSCRGDTRCSDTPDRVGDCKGHRGRADMTRRPSWSSGRAGSPSAIPNLASHSTTSASARSGVCSRRIAVIHASTLASSAFSGRTLRSSQQRSGARSHRRLPCRAACASTLSAGCTLRIFSAYRSSKRRQRS